MSFLFILRFLKGYVSIRVTGGFPERFINLCNREGINLWDVTFENNGLTAKVYCKEFKKLITIRRNTGVHIEIKNKKGLNFLLKQYSNRKGLALGFVFGMVFLVVMNMFVWSIDVTGSNKFSKDEILQVTEIMGLHIGTFVPMFDRASASREAINAFDGEILWLSINIKGSKATIEVRDYENIISKTTNDFPCNLIADFDGLIVETQNFSGQQIVFTGENVKKGDILISGTIENDEEIIDLIASDGSFSARHSKHLEHTHNEESRQSILTFTKRLYSLDFFGFEIPLYFFNQAKKDTITYYKQFAELSNNKFPFGITKLADTTIFPNDEKDGSLLRAVDAFTCMEYKDMKNTAVISADYEIFVPEKTYVFKGNYDCVDFIGKKSPIIN